MDVGGKIYPGDKACKGSGYDPREVNEALCGSNKFLEL